MARWSKLDARFDSEIPEHHFRTKPSNPVRNSYGSENCAGAEIDDFSLLNAIDNIDLETLDNSFSECLETLFLKFGQTRRGIYLLAIAKIFTRIFEEEDHYYQENCETCYVCGLGAIRFCLMAKMFNADDDAVTATLGSISTHFPSQHDFQYICQREGNGIIESLKTMSVEEFLKTFSN